MDSENGLVLLPPMRPDQVRLIAHAVEQLRLDLLAVRHAPGPSYHAQQFTLAELDELSQLLTHGRSDKL